MKKFFTMLVAVCFMLVGGVGVVSASAAEITPFASPVISDVDYYISSSLCYFTAKLNQSYSGTISANVQKSVSGSWQNHTNICSNSSFNSNMIYKSKSTSLESGTYRISITVTINGVDYTTNTGSVTI